MQLRMAVFPDGDKQPLLYTAGLSPLPALECQVQGHSLQFVSGDALHIGSAMTGLRTLAIGATIGAAGEAEAGSAGEQLAEE